MVLRGCEECLGHRMKVTACKWRKLDVSWKRNEYVRVYNENSVKKAVVSCR